MSAPSSRIRLNNGHPLLAELLQSCYARRSGVTSGRSFQIRSDPTAARVPACGSAEAMSWSDDTLQTGAYDFGIGIELRRGAAQASASRARPICWTRWARSCGARARLMGASYKHILSAASAEENRTKGGSCDSTLACSQSAKVVHLQTSYAGNWLMVAQLANEVLRIPSYTPDSLRGSSRTLDLIDPTGAG